MASALAAPFEDVAQQRRAADLGIWIFLATEVLFFGVLFAAYAFMRLAHPAGFAAGSRLTDVVLGSANTAVLLTSSLTMALSVRAAKLGAARASATWLGATAALGILFLLIKGAEYHIDYGEQLVPAVNFAYAGADARGVELFFVVYFLTTLIHALHLAIGIALVMVMRLRTRRGAFSGDYFTPVEVTGLYWHLVDIVWIFLYPLLYLVSRS